MRRKTVNLSPDTTDSPALAEMEANLLDPLRQSIADFAAFHTAPDKRKEGESGPFLSDRFVRYLADSLDDLPPLHPNAAPWEVCEAAARLLWGGKPCKEENIDLPDDGYGNAVTAFRMARLYTVDALSTGVDLFLEACFAVATEYLREHPSPLKEKREQKETQP